MGGKEQAAEFVRRQLKSLGKLRTRPSLLVKESWAISRRALKLAFPDSFPTQRSHSQDPLVDLELSERIPRTLAFDLRYLRHLRNAAEHDDLELEVHQSEYAIQIVNTLARLLASPKPSSPTRRTRGFSLAIYKKLMEHVVDSPSECDDCIAAGTSVKPRQRVRYFLLRMEGEGFVMRHLQVCAGCDKEKIVALPLEMPGDAKG